MPNKLYHWTEAHLSEFHTDEKPNRGWFKVDVQGLAFAGRGFRWLASTTRRIRARSLIVFVGEAAALFRPYDLLKFDGLFKRPLGQFHTRQRGDVVWNNSDTVQKGVVLVVGRAQIIPITDKTRLSKRKRERATRSLGWPLYLSPIFLGFVATLIGEQAYAYFEPYQSTAFTVLCWFLAAVAVLIVFAVWFTIQFSSRPDVSTDLPAALQEAVEKGLLDD